MNLVMALPHRCLTVLFVPNGTLSKREHRRGYDITGGREREWSVCDDPIREKSSTCGGDDALQCEGRCQSWFHRCCAGVSSKHFSDLSVSSEPFL